MKRKLNDTNNYVWRVTWINSVNRKQHTAYCFRGPNVVIYATNSRDDALEELERLRVFGLPVLEKVHPYVKLRPGKEYLGGLERQ